MPLFHESQRAQREVKLPWYLEFSQCLGLSAEAQVDRLAPVQLAVLLDQLALPLLGSRSSNKFCFFHSAHHTIGGMIGGSRGYAPEYDQPHT